MIVDAVHCDREPSILKQPYNEHLVSVNHLDSLGHPLSGLDSAVGRGRQVKISLFQIVAVLQPPLEELPDVQFGALSITGIDRLHLVSDTEDEKTE